MSLLAHVYESFERPRCVRADVVQPCVERAGVLALPRADLLRDSEGLLQRHDFRPARLSVLHALVLLLVAVLMIPAYAWADVLPDTPDETVLGTKVGRAVDPNSAVFVAVGKSIDSLTSEQQAAFINATTGTEGLESYAYFRGTMYTPTSTVGPVSATYYSTLTGTEYAMACAAARSDIVNYLKGSGSGGGSGGSGGGIEPSTTFILHAQYTSIKSNGSYQYQFTFGGSKHTFSTADTSTLAPETVTVTISQSQLDAIVGAAGDNDIVVILGSGDGTSQQPTTGTLVFYFVESGYTMPSGSFSSRNDRGIVYSHVSDNISGKSVSNVLFNSTVDVSNKTLRDSTYSTSEQYVRMNWGSAYYGVLRSGSGGGGGSTPEPEPDPTPVQPVNPTGPTITGPTININTGGNNSTTTTADLTPILEMLRIINGNVIVINDNLTAFSDWFGDAWGDYVDWLQLWFERFGLSLDNIYSQQELVGQNIVNELREIEDLLWYIFYKPDPEYPTPAAYDDSAVLAKLQEIIDYLGGFETDYEPDIDDGNTAGEQLSEDVSSLKAKFPFCMPFELHALLALLQAPMEIPVFTVTLPMWGTLTFDMAQWSDSLAICRACSILWVIGGLFTLTSKMISYFGMPSLGGD